MTVETSVEEKTIEQINEMLDDVMRVDPENVALDQKLNILIEELEQTNEELAETQQDLSSKKTVLEANGFDPESDAPF